MIDLHNHILPGIDDGAIDLEESLEIARTFLSEGVNRVTATPHRDPDKNKGLEASEVRVRVRELQTALDEAQVPLDVLQGTELYLTPEAPALVRNGLISPLGHGNYFLVEVAFDQRSPLWMEDSLFQMQLHGFQPVLAHPERYAFVQKDPSSIEPLMERGIIFQLTAPALLGEYGRTVQGTAETLLRRGWYALAASDRHHPGHNRSLLDLHGAIANLTSSEVADLLLKANPRRVIEGDDLEMPETRPDERVGLLGRLFRLG